MAIPSIKQTKQASFDAVRSHVGSDHTVKQDGGVIKTLGISLKSQHYHDVLSKMPSVDFFEVHAENYMVDGGVHHRFLGAINEHYDLSLHGVGMSLGSADGLSKDHVRRFKNLVDRYQPKLVSEHLAWSVDNGTYLNDLLPLPLTNESLEIVSRNIGEFQNSIGRAILIENPSSYLAFTESTIPEAEFLNRLAEKTGCGLLLDINNIAVSAANLGYTPEGYLAAIDMQHVGEIHLAGHLVKHVDGVEIRIDDHGSPVSNPVIDLYAGILDDLPDDVATLIEWDTNVPDLDGLVGEANRVRSAVAVAACDSLRKVSA